MNPNYGLMVELKPEFQRKIFHSLIKEYGIKKLEKDLGRVHGTIYNYKNYRVRSIPLKILNKVFELSKISKEECNKNILKSYMAEEARKECFELGIRFRKNFLKKQFNLDIKLKNIIVKEKNDLYIDIERWFKETNWIEKIKDQRGVIRNMKQLRLKDGYIILEYEAYSKSIKTFKKFIRTIPTKIKMDEEFLYFIGLRYGDGINGARIGIVNKNFELIKYTSIYLRKLFPNTQIQGYIYLHKVLDKVFLNNLKYKMHEIIDEVAIIKNYRLMGSYVLYVFVTNEFFNKIYNKIVDELDLLFKNLNFKQKGAFLAGFFDAEGNVNKIDRNFRFSQKIKHKVNIINRLLENEGYHVRYDSSNLIIGYRKEFREFDLELFKKQILPFIKHPEKMQEAIELINGYYVRDKYKEIVKIIKNNPGIDSHGIFNITKVKNNYRKLTDLNDNSLIKRNRIKVDETFKYFVTEKGIKWIEGVD